MPIVTSVVGQDQADALCERVKSYEPWWLSLSTGALLPPACRAWVCPVCGPRKARRYASALDRDGYDRWVTLTRAPRDLRQGCARVAYLVRKVAPWQWAWSAEAGQVSGMVHVHAVVRSPYVHHTDLRSAARQAGFGRVLHIAAAEGGAARYSAKAAQYSAKESRSGYLEWLALNTSRPWHFSRGYTRGEPVREWVRRLTPPRDPGPWARVPGPRPQ